MQPKTVPDRTRTGTEWYANSELPMNVSDKIELTLAHNSHAFLREAASKFVAAQLEPAQWQFAIISLVQSLELALKAKLKEIHPLFVYDDIDEPKHTINIARAISRLTNPNIGGIALSEKDKKKIIAAIKVRNELTHAEHSLNPSHAEHSFCFVFSYVADFFRYHLRTSVSEIVAITDLESIIRSSVAREELRKRALVRIEQREIPDNEIRDCPECCEWTFVLYDGECTCYTCLHHLETVECPRCGDFNYFAEEMVSLHDEFDTDMDEGRYIVLNRFGVGYDEVCPECSGSAREEINDNRQSEYMNEMEQEYHSVWPYSRR